MGGGLTQKSTDLSRVKKRGRHQARPIAYRINETCFLRNGKFTGDKGSEAVPFLFEKT